MSVAVAEHDLLPAVRAAGDDAVVLADGFSCRTQLEDLAGVRALHLAELLDRARGGPGYLRWHSGDGPRPRRRLEGPGADGRRPLTAPAVRSF